MWIYFLYFYSPEIYTLLLKIMLTNYNQTKMMLYNAHCNYDPVNMTVMHLIREYLRIEITILRLYRVMKNISLV